jgi:hypothetical protein
LAIFEALAIDRLFRASVDQSAVQGGGGKRFTFARVLQRDREIEQQKPKEIKFFFSELLP